MNATIVKLFLNFLGSNTCTFCKTFTCSYKSIMTLQYRKVGLFPSGNKFLRHYIREERVLPVFALFLRIGLQYDEVINDKIFLSYAHTYMSL